MEQSDRREKRKHERFDLDVHMELLASSVTTGSSLLKGQIVNISQGGLAVRYLTSEDNTIQIGSDVVCTFGLYPPLLTIENVASTVMYDSAVDMEIPGSLHLRQCGIQYSVLTEIQCGKVKEFIQIRKDKSGNSKLTFIEVRAMSS